MEPGYITLIILFGMSQITTMAIIVFLVFSRNKHFQRCEELRAEIFEQYRKRFSESDKTTDKVVSTLNNTTERRK